MRRVALVLALVLAASCAKKGGSCEGAKQTALQAIEVARARTQEDIVASTAAEARLATQRQAPNADAALGESCRLRPRAPRC